MRKILIDQGHDNKRNQSNVFPSYYESVAMYNLGLYLKADLERLGFIADTTRKSLSEVKDVVARGLMAKGYDFAISLHTNACGTESVDRPCAIYLCPDNKTLADEKSKELGDILAEVCYKTIGTNQVPKNYCKVAGYDRNGNGILTDDEYYGVLYGFHQVNVPGIILECTFHTNLKATKWMYEDSNLRNLSKALANGIAKYYGLQTVVIQPVDEAEVIEYTVVSGDTLGKIADRYNTTVSEIMALNHDRIKDKSKIYVGQIIYIPKNSVVASVAKYHTVNRNDGLTNLSKIASAYGITLQAIKLMNPQITAPLYIVHYGDKIRVN